MGLLRYLHRRKKHEAKEKQQQSRSLPDGSSHQSSSHSSDPSSRRSSGSTASRTSKHRSSVDEYNDRERQRLIETFRIIDKDGDGRISKEELGMMWTNLGEHITEEELTYMIRDADADGDGLIDFEEFIKLQKIMGIEEEEEQSREIKLAFNLADVDHSGLISAGELQKVLKQLGQHKVTLEECVDMCRLVDDDGDGMISFEEFEHLMKSSAFSHDE